MAATHVHVATGLGANRLVVVDGDLDLNSGLNADGGDLLDHVSGGVQVDEALVDPVELGGAG